MIPMHKLLAVITTLPMIYLQIEKKTLQTIVSVHFYVLRCRLSSISVSDIVIAWSVLGSFTLQLSALHFEMNREKRTYLNR